MWPVVSCDLCSNIFPTHYKSNKCIKTRAGPRPRPKAPTTKFFYPLQKRPHIIVKGRKFYKKYDFFSNCCALFIINDVRDITNFIIHLQTDMLPITKKYFKYSLITLLKLILHYYCHIILWTFCSTFSIFLFLFLTRL